VGELLFGKNDEEETNSKWLNAPILFLSIIY